MTLLSRSVINKLAKPFSYISRNDGSENKRGVIVSLKNKKIESYQKKALFFLNVRVYQFFLLGFVFQEKIAFEIIVFSTIENTNLSTCPVLIDKCLLQLELFCYFPESKKYFK